jgi:tetratricopeptide (TPR) repeat protein
MRADPRKSRHALRRVRLRPRQALRYETMIGEYSTAELCRIMRLDQSQLRTCLRAALLPIPRVKTSRRYTFQDLVLLRTAKGLTDAGVPVRQIQKVLTCLQRQIGDGQALTSLKIYAFRKRVVVWDGAYCWQPESGQFLFNFHSTGTVTRVRLRPPPRSLAQSPETAEAWFERAVMLEEDAPEDAQRGYQEAIRLQPDFVNAHISLGLLYHHAGDLTKAEACYRQALLYDPKFALVHFNLAVVLEDQQKTAQAIAAYEEAVQHAPNFWEAHCNLAQLYERAGRKRDAIRHYAAARRLKG